MRAMRQSSASKSRIWQLPAAKTSNGKNVAMCKHCASVNLQLHRLHPERSVRDWPGRAPNPQRGLQRYEENVRRNKFRTRRTMLKISKSRAKSHIFWYIPLSTLKHHDPSQYCITSNRRFFDTPIDNAGIYVGSERNNSLCESCSVLLIRQCACSHSNISYRFSVLSYDMLIMYSKEILS